MSQPHAPSIRPLREAVSLDPGKLLDPGRLADFGGHAADDPVLVLLAAGKGTRFGLAPQPEFVDVHPGGGASGIRLGRYDVVPSLIRHLNGMALR
jgi:hypothetical protein